MIQQALARYAFDGMDAVLIRHNENMTYCVGGKYLLRIHRHREGFSTAWSGAASPLALRGEELRFLARLNAAGIRVQTPLANRDGEYVTVLGDGTLVTALTWIPGRTVEKADVTPAFSASLGELVGRMHRAAEQSGAAPSMRYDAALCERLVGWLDRLPETALLARCRPAMRDALHGIRAYLALHEGELIAVHSDLSRSNLLITESGLVPIDFSLFGIGHPMLDVGGVFASICETDEQRRGFADGYAAAGCAIGQRGVDTSFALQILLGIALHYDMWKDEAWFHKRLPEWCGEVFSRI